MQGSSPAGALSPTTPPDQSWGRTTKPEHFSAQLRNLGQGLGLIIPDSPQYPRARGDTHPVSLSILEGWAAQSHAEGRRMKNRNGHGWPFHKWHFKTGSSVAHPSPCHIGLYQSSSLAHTLSLTQPSALPRLEEVIFK